AEGDHWAAMGDWNMEADVLDFGWVRKLRAQIRVADAPTCRQGSGSKIDYVVVSKSLACFAAAPPLLDRDASTWPHWPVHLPLRSVRVEEAAKSGCARGLWRWTEVMRCVQATHDGQGLQIIWGLLLEGVETEILNRRDLVGPARRTFAGRGTQGEDAGLKWELAQWRPPQKRELRGPEAHAWAALAGCASELLSKRDRLAKLLAALDSHRQEEGRAAAAARDKCMKPIAATLAHLRMFVANIGDHVRWRILPPWAQRPFRADANWTETDFERDLKRALAEAQGRQRKMVQADEARWKKWVDEAFLGGAGAAHATSKAPVLQEVLPALQAEGSAALVDREMKPWIDIWNYHGLTSMVLPSDAHTWDALPPLQLHDVHDVLRSFPWRTGVGQPGIPPRALEDLSDDALHVMIAVFHKCEEPLVWPSGRLINTMVRLPKPEGGCRLLGLMPTLVRVWGRARRPITKAWEPAHPSSLVWGTGPGRSSSGSACELNLAKEQARLGGWDSAQAALDLWKAYEMVAPEAQLVEARALGFPLGLAWMLLSTYRQPRTLAAFNTTSDLFVAWQGNIAGCGHANSLLLVLTLRALQRAHSIAPSVTPRGLVDDVTLDWSSLVACPTTASPRGLAEKFRMRNLGHELHGRKVLRTQGKRRLQALAARRSRVAMLRRAAGRRAAALVATGLSPSAGHGAGVAGLADRPLAQLCTLAAVTAGAKAGCGTAAVMLLQRRVDDPIYAATIPLVMRLTSRIWEGRGSPASLNASRRKLAEAVRAGTLSWATAHGPLGATWLALGRIGWTMTAAWALQTDLGDTLSMLRVAPRDIKDALVEGIQRWQCRRLVAQLPEGQGETLWPRAVRAIASRARPAAELGAIQAVWAGGHFTNAWRYARGYTDFDVRQACGGAKDTLMHRWCVCPALMVPRDDELEHEEPFHKPIVAMRHQLEDAEQKWTIGDSELPLAYGLPLLPAMPPPAPSDNVVIEWSATQVGRPSVVYTDGSAHASQVPEARRCGWAAVALRPDGPPLKAAYGPLPGPRQTVGRAERHACLAPLAQAGSVQVIVSDLQSPVTEGNSWSPTAQSARARHASIWRQLHAAAARRDGPPPRFRWVPAHRSLQQALAEGLRPLGWLGSCWADLFANLGAAETRLPNNTAEALRAELQRALDTATYLGWAAARICQLDLWGPLGEDGRLQRRHVWREPAAPKLSLTRHEYQAISSCGVQCVHCGREAYTAKARALLDCRPCQPTELGRLRARCRQDRPPASSAAVNASLQAAERLEEEELPPTNGAPTAADCQRRTMQQKIDYLLEAAKGAPTAGPADAEAAETPQAALCTLASSWIVDLMDQSLAYASWMEECVDYVYRMLDEAAYRGFFVHNSAETRSAERLRRAGEFCERGWRGGGPFREAHIDEALQLEGEARRVKLQRLRGYRAAARAFLCDRGSAQHAGGRALRAAKPRRRGRRCRGQEASTRGHSGPWARGLTPPNGAGRGPPANHSGSEPNSSPDPDAAVGLEVQRSMLRAFAGCWAFDLRNSDAAEDGWMAWAAQYALTWPARPENGDAGAVATRRAGSIGLRALVQAMVRQAWLMKADVRRITVGHLMGLATLEEWLHAAAMQWATLDEVCSAMEDIIGEAAVNLSALPGFAGTWRNPQLPLVNVMQGTPDDQGSGSDDEDGWPHPDAAPSGLPPPPPAAAVEQEALLQPAQAAQDDRGEAEAAGYDDPVRSDGEGEAAAACGAGGLPVAAACALAAVAAAAAVPGECGGGGQ
ncbi:unnamed protein product, partial [Prorocentrum cordatum]